MEKSAYQEGYEAAAIPPPQQPACPYPDGSKESEEWWRGFSDWTDDRWFNEQWDAEHA